MTRPPVLLPDLVAEPGMALLREHCEIVAPVAGSRDFTDEDMARGEGILLRMSDCDAAFMARAPKLKVIARHGVGVDSVDVAEATRRKIAVTITPTSNFHAVAEHAIHLMLAVSRQVVWADALTRGTAKEGFSARVGMAGYELTGKTIGIVGLGRIGKRLAELCAGGFHMTVLGVDPALDAATYAGPAKLFASVDEILPQIDILSLHAPAIPATHHLLNAERLAAMKKGAVVINTARGPLIDEPALADALHRGHIAGAGLDVFEIEPPPPGSPILDAPNTVFSPHVASSTQEALDRMAAESAQCIIDILNGRRPAGLFNPEIHDGAGSA